MFCESIWALGMLVYLGSRFALTSSERSCVRASDGAFAFSADSIIIS